MENDSYDDSPLIRRPCHEGFLAGVGHGVWLATCGGIADSSLGAVPAAVPATLSEGRH